MIGIHWIVFLIVLVKGGAGIGHILQPDLFTGFFLDPLPPASTVIVAGMMHIVVAVVVIVPKSGH